MKTPPREAVILGIGSALSAGVIIGGIVWGLNRESTEQTVANAAHSVNVAASAARASVVTGRDGIARLVLRGVQPTVEMADVSPGYERLRVPTWIWSRMWPQLYGSVSPNATIVWGAGGHRQSASVSLASGVYRPGYMAFAVRPLSPGATQAMPLTGGVSTGSAASLGPVDLYVDPSPPGQSIVNTILQTLAGTPVEPNSTIIVTKPPPATEIVPNLGGAAYSGLALASGYPSSAAVDIHTSGNPIVASANFPGRTVVITNGITGGAAFEQMNVSGGTLRLANLSNSAFINLNLTGGTLIGGAKTTFLDANFTNTTFGAPAAPNGEVSLVNFRDAVFAQPILTGATFPDGGDLRSNAFEGAVFLGTDFTGVNVSQDTDPLDMGGVTIAPFNRETPSGTPVTIPSSFAGMQNLVNLVNFSNNGVQKVPTVLNSVDFTGSGLQGVNFASATLVNCDFSNATLAEPTGDQGSPVGTKFDGATITGGSFAGADISAAAFDSARITGVNFADANLNVAANPQEGGRPSVYFDGATLTNVAFLSNSTIEQAGFKGAILDGVVFSTNNGQGSPVSFVSRLLSEISATTGAGLTINNTAYVKQDGVAYQVTSQGRWQPLSLAGGQVTNNGPEVPAGGGPLPPNPDPNPDPNPGPLPDNGGGNVQPEPGPGPENNGGEFPDPGTGEVFGTAASGR